MAAAVNAYCEHVSIVVIIRGALRQGPCVDNITGLQLVLSFPPLLDGKGRDSLHSREGEMRSSLPKQLVTQTDTSSSSLSCSCPGFINICDSWECQITPPYTKNSGIIANSGLFVERSSSTRGAVLLLYL